jgi:hypothetical protein
MNLYNVGAQPCNGDPAAGVCSNRGWKNRADTQKMFSLNVLCGSLPLWQTCHLLARKFARTAPAVKARSEQGCETAALRSQTVAVAVLRRITGIPRAFQPTVAPCARSVQPQGRRPCVNAATLRVWPGALVVPRFGRLCGAVATFRLCAPMSHNLLKNSCVFEDPGWLRWMDGIRTMIANRWRIDNCPTQELP